MDPERWRRLQELFHRAVDLGERERAAFVAAECAGDAELRAELDQLLASDPDADDAFRHVADRARPAPRDPRLGRRLGVYELVDRIAEGGMGVVYRARRVDGLFEHDVAIKLIRAECATEWMLRRFEFERRTLAALQHPCIARLYDGGTTDDGCPYFVMEFVQGERIDRHCERARLLLDARLRLFVQVARAVQVAHQSLVVHCDLKPANILIDERGTPRLLDFGIARLSEDAPAEAKSPSSNTIARVLTPEYASPEQLAGAAVTTAFDVYALGVLLYELATGRRPFESDSRSPAEWERIVREEEPVRPSTRAVRATEDAGAIAAQFQLTPAALRRALRGDLDRIVLMALRKEPERRYASVQELADDVERHLAHEPVRARGNSLAYLARTFVRRHRVPVAAGVLVFAALLVGLLAARHGERVAAAEARHAQTEADSFASIADFLMDAFLPAQPAQDAEWQARARERVLEQAERVRRQHANADHERANLLDTLGQVALRLDLQGDAEGLLREALAIRERAFGRQSLEYALSLQSLARHAYAVGDYAAAVALLDEALPIHRAAGSSTHADVSGLQNDLAAALRNLGREAEAEALHEAALAARRADDDGSLPVAESLNNLAGIHLARGEFERALRELREALAVRASILGDGHLLTLQTGSNLAAAAWRAGEVAEAKERMRRVEAGYRALGVDGEDGLGLALSNLAAMQLGERDLDGASASLREALALQQKRLGADHPVVAVTLATLAAWSHARGRDDEARALWEDVLRIRRAPDGNPRELAEALYGFGVFHSDVGEAARAEELVREAIALHAAHDLRDPLALARAESVLGGALARLGRKEEAREHLEAAARLFEGQPSAGEGELARVRRFLERLDRPAGG
ncbi:MAG: serine/threonine protein kinase [Planctomycetes bacterium]|nr:serine/threonine protein kinase [Planctomycetota bacterium]